MDETTTAIVESARAGDRRALAALYRHFAPLVHGILLAYVPVGEADDLVQDVFESVMGHLPSLRDARAFPGWLVVMTRRRALNGLRRPATEPVAGVENEDARQSPETDAEARRVLEAIRALAPAYRETLMLRLVEGLGGPEIAALTGLTEGSVRVNLHRGMQRLRRALGIDTSEVSDDG